MPTASTTDPIRPPAAPRRRPALLAAAVVCAYAAFLAWIAFTSEISYSSEDTLWMRHTVRFALSDASPPLSDLLTNFGLRSFRAGSRLNVLLLALLGRDAAPGYAAVLCVAIAWQSATLATLLWALHGAIRTRTTWLFGLAWALAPLPATINGLLFIGNHSETCLFVFVTLGTVLRLRRAPPGGRAEAAHALLTGLIAGFGLYYFQGFALWLAVLAGAVLERAIRSPVAVARTAPWVLLGLAPSVAWLAATYWPDHLHSVVLPYQWEPGSAGGEAVRSFTALDPGALAETARAFWSICIYPEIGLLAADGGAPAATRLLAAAGSSPLWLGAILLARRSPNDTLRFATLCTGAFALLYLLAATLSGVTDARHGVPPTFAFLTLQALALGEILPAAAAALARRWSSGAALLRARAIPLIPLALGIAIAAGRAPAYLRLGGQESWSTGWRFPVDVCVEVGINGLPVRMGPTVAALADRARSFALDEAERSAWLTGVGRCFGDVDLNILRSLPREFPGRITPKHHCDALGLVLAPEEPDPTGIVSGASSEAVAWKLAEIDPLHRTAIAASLAMLRTLPGYSEPLANRPCPACSSYDAAVEKLRANPEHLSTVAFIDSLALHALPIPPAE